MNQRSLPSFAWKNVYPVITGVELKVTGSDIYKVLHKKGYIKNCPIKKLSFPKSKTF